MKTKTIREIVRGKKGKVYKSGEHPFIKFNYRKMPENYFEYMNKDADYYEQNLELDE